MANDLPLFPELLSEAKPLSLNDLAIMHPDDLIGAGELAYVAELRAYRERYEKALGATKAKAKPRKDPTRVLNVTFGPADTDSEDAF